MLYQVLIGLDVIVALLLVGLILIQQGKGADMGASFGSGGSNTVFGSTGSGNFLTRSTAVLATLFFIINLALGTLSNKVIKQVDEWDDLSAPAVSTIPSNIDVPVAAPVATDIPASSTAPVADGAAEEKAEQTDDGQ